MGDSPPQFLVLLSGREMECLLMARNRDKFQPYLKECLHAGNRMAELRQLAFLPTEADWDPPVLTVRESGEVIDSTGALRGRIKQLPLPARPGEPQMALTYDWFWEELCGFLLKKGVWTSFVGDTVEIVIPAGIEFSLEDAWKDFWQRLSSREHLNGSMGIYLDNKSLFKNPARAWGGKEIPILSESMARFLIDYYRSGRAQRHFKKNSIPEAIESLEQTVQRGSYTVIPLPRSTMGTYIKGGDYYEGRGLAACLSCGDILPKKESYERLAVFVKDADERLQSGPEKDKKPRFCPRCVATVMLCPVKLTKETLTVRFLERPGNSHGPRAAGPGSRFVRQEIRKYVAQTLHVAAGSFVGLHADEWIDGKQGLYAALGARHYALWKMAVTFPPELFAQGFTVEVYPGEETFQLPRWLTWFASSLARWETGLQYRCYREKELRPHFFQFLRLISQEKVFQGFYTLLTGGIIGNYSKSWRINHLQNIWRQLESVLREEERMPVPDYPKIVGLAGLLLPLAERVENSKTTDKEKKRAVGKLLEEVDRPIQYAYTASRESGSRDFLFCQWPRNRYFFEKALQLLEWAGEDIAKLRSEGNRIALENEALAWAREAEQKIFIGPDQIARVAGALLCEGEKPYENEADWRAFAYQVKLALWSMFPQHLGPESSR